LFEHRAAEESTLPFSQERRRRIAACLAACDGISTRALEAGILLRLIAACIHVREPRIREILEELAEESDRGELLDPRQSSSRRNERKRGV